MNFRERIRSARKLLARCVVALAFICGANAVLAQQPSYHLGLMGIQSGTVAPHGVGFLGFALTNKRSPTLNDADGSAGFGFGLGDARKSVGVQLTAHITSLSDSFGDSGYLSVKFARQLHAGTAPVFGSLQFGHLAKWGDARAHPETVSAAVTRFSRITTADGLKTYPVMMTLGAGSHMRNNDTDPAIFGGIGVGISPSTAVSLAWTGESLMAGASFKFEAAENWRFALGVDDVTNRLNNRRLVLSVGYSFSNLFGG